MTKNKTEHISYMIHGDGKPVLLIHGWSMHSGVWNHFVEEFASMYKVITVDLRGHGKSAAMDGPYNFETFSNDITWLIDSLKLRDVTLIGWSMGVSIILNLFNSISSTADSLVLISGNPSLVKRGDYEHALPEVTVKKLFKQIERDCAKGLDNFHKLLFTQEEFSAHQHSSIYQIITDKRFWPSQKAALESLSWSRVADFRAALKNVTVPTLIIHGSDDGICLPAASYYMHERIRNSQLLFLEKTGHVPFITRKQEVHGAIHEFLTHLK